MGKLRSGGLCDHGSVIITHYIIVSIESMDLELFMLHGDKQKNKIPCSIHVF